MPRQYPLTLDTSVQYVHEIDPALAHGNIYVMCDPTLSEKAKLVYGLASTLSKKGMLSTPLSQIAETTNVKFRTLRKGTKELVSRGLMEMATPANGRGNFAVYRVINPVIQKVRKGYENRTLSTGKGYQNRTLSSGKGYENRTLSAPSIKGTRERGMNKTIHEYNGSSSSKTQRKNGRISAPPSLEVFEVLLQARQILGLDKLRKGSKHEQRLCRKIHKRMEEGHTPDELLHAVRMAAERYQRKNWEKFRDLSWVWESGFDQFRNAKPLPSKTSRDLLQESAKQATQAIYDLSEQTVKDMAEKRRRKEESQRV